MFRERKIGGIRIPLYDNVDVIFLQSPKCRWKELEPSSIVEIKGSMF
jgi:hypothetical protein